MPSDPLFRRISNRVRQKPRRKTNARAKSSVARLGHDFETLEDRSLLSATYLPINPAGANPAEMAALGGQVLFAANDGADGVELWKSDGTLSGTALVKDINPGSTVVGGVSTPNISNPTDLDAHGDYIYFDASDGANGAQLWRSDDTAGGT